MDALDAYLAARILFLASWLAELDALHPDDRIHVLAEVVDLLQPLAEALEGGYPASPL